MNSDNNTEAVQEILRKAAPRWFDGFALGIFAGNVKHECIYIYIHIWSPPMIYLETFYMGITMFLLHTKHNRGEKQQLTEGALMGDRFLHMDVSIYMWVVILISNALLFNGNGWFIFFGPTTSPPGLLHPIICFTLSCSQYCLQPYLSWFTSRKANKTRETNKTRKTKKIQQNKKETTKNERMWFWFKTMFCLVVLSFVWFLVLKWKKTLILLAFWMDISKKQNNYN